eukprot:TRINITY_DN2062_c0_g1_i1.p1 TRINITY_DN2062_c0_g1~~TRINITY_DN2062_c0_g1_i1.p1  ORF type:complete len:343 (+),score=87.93 TRINITY_DN2062_c0_g1_i1:39-1067(+)
MLLKSFVYILFVLLAVARSEECQNPLFETGTTSWDPLDYSKELYSTVRASTEAFPATSLDACKYFASGDSCCSSDTLQKISDSITEYQVQLKEEIDNAVNSFKLMDFVDAYVGGILGTFGMSGDFSSVCAILGKVIIIDGCDEMVASASELLSNENVQAIGTSVNECGNMLLHYYKGMLCSSCMTSDSYSSLVDSTTNQLTLSKDVAKALFGQCKPMFDQYIDLYNLFSTIEEKLLSKVRGFLGEKYNSSLSDFLDAFKLCGDLSSNAKEAPSLELCLQTIEEEYLQGMAFKLPLGVFQTPSITGRILTALRGAVPELPNNNIIRKLVDSDATITFAGRFSL